MDNVRLFLVMALVFISLLMYEAWQKDYGAKPISPTTTPISTPLNTGVNSTLPTPSTTTSTSVPVDGQLTKASSALPQASIQLFPSENIVKVETDVMQVEINTVGGDLRQKSLIDYPISVEDHTPFRLLNDSLPNVFVAQSGLLPAENAPSHVAVYQSAQNNYHLANGQDTLAVPLVWTNEQGITVKKVFIFTRGSHAIKVQHIVDNQSEQPWQVRQYAQFQRTEVKQEYSNFVYTYLGGAVSSPQQMYERVTFKQIHDSEFSKRKELTWKNGWVGMLQHYFVGAWIPPREQAFTYYTNYLQEGARYILGFYSDTQVIAAKQQHTFELTLYAGPKIQDNLAKLATGLDLTVDYGWLWFIAQPIFWLLSFCHTIFSSWGMAIIMVTLLIKLAFFKLSATSYKSMAQMRKMQPRLQALKERYADDSAKLNQAMMDLYREEKINPLSGCLPIFVQIPVFIALYWVLLESVELRLSSFLWLQDLSRPDPFFILPLIMGATMLIQHHLNPTPVDPIQEKMMLMLPIVFTVFFAFFPSGLVLYWVINNALSIAQQWVITKKIAGNV